MDLRGCCGGAHHSGAAQTVQRRSEPDGHLWDRAIAVNRVFAMGRAAVRHGVASLARCVQCRAMVRPGLGISVMIASLLAPGVAVAGTGLPATATVPVRSMFRGSYEPPKNPEH